MRNGSSTNLYRDHQHAPLTGWNPVAECPLKSKKWLQPGSGAPGLPNSALWGKDPSLHFVFGMMLSRIH
ncbi:hypothetical protein J4Q44_G00229180 [Coregonus suidteri]|uniref:Uncharacterized protein n=1 Tax=Coregonus suidteri TaxID=861788 RepID=A0AAN8LAD1_9TELE